MEDLPRGLVPFGAIAPGGIKPDLVAGGFGEEVGACGELLDFIEFVLNEAVDGFDVGLPGMCGRGDGVMAHAADGLHGLRKGTGGLGVPSADELTAIVGLNPAVAEAD